MFRYIFKRLLQSIPTLLGVSLIGFILIHAAPGNPVDILFDPTLSKEEREMLIEHHGLDQPLALQYVKWMTGFTFREGNVLAESIRPQYGCQHRVGLYLSVCNSPAFSVMGQIAQDFFFYLMLIFNSLSIDSNESGGVWIRGESADASILNPILSSDSASSAVHTMIFPSLLGTDAFSGETVPTEMAESWDVSDDGLVWTFNLRDGVVWSDGEAVDADDFKFTYDAIASVNVETPRKSNVEQIESIEVVDPLTIEVTFKEVKCDGLLDLGLGWLPSHLYADDFSDIMENEYNQAPPVSAAPFIFQEWTRDDNVQLVRNDTYWKGAPYMEGMIYRVILDLGDPLAALQTGEVDIIGLHPEQISAAEEDENLNIFNFKDDGYSYIGLNLANPENPEPGRDEDGNLVEQEAHPILGDKAVRLAIAHSLDYETIIETVYLGQGYQIASNVLPVVGWAHDPDIAPYEYDTELAAKILEEAGWIDEDGDGVREKDGQPLELNLVTNAGNTNREHLGVLAQDQLNNAGFNITFRALDFGTLVEQLLDQTFDMIIIGWTGLGTDPNDDAFWHSKFDTPGSGFNFVSYSNERIDELLEEGVAIPGCAAKDRAPIYQEIQQIIHDDIPYVFMTGSVGNRGYSNKFQGLDPGAWNFYHNVEQWSLAE